MNNSFLLGAATSAYQVEGYNVNSDAWVMEHMKFTPYSEKSGIADDQYHRFEEDIDLIKKAGLNAYRFSIEWSRIEPQEGQFDLKEVEHYRQVLEYCKKQGIEPVVTLLHFTSPTWIISQGGWNEPKTADYFARYAKFITEKLGKYFSYVCTLNEANMWIETAEVVKQYKRKAQKSEKSARKNGEAHVTMGLNLKHLVDNMDAIKAENKEAFGIENPVLFNSQSGDEIPMRAHAKAKKAIKEINPNIKVGLTLALHDVQVGKDGEQKAEELWKNEFTRYIPYIKDDDFLGVQCYTRTTVGPNGQMPNPKGAKLSQMGYEDYPQALGHVLEKVHEDLPIDLLVTENGLATDNDKDREEYIKVALEGVKTAQRKGVPVKGYFYWSLLDNFEWQKGFSRTFGLIAVDRKTMKRIPKPSLKYLGSFLPWQD